jgi:hypothetical protein
MHDAGNEDQCQVPFSTVEYELSGCQLDFTVMMIHSKLCQTNFPVTHKQH